MPLLLLPLILKGSTHFALLDSGASDSFISADVVKQSGLRPVPLKETIRVRVANGQSLDVAQIVRVTVFVVTLHRSLFLIVITTTLSIVFGVHFMQQFNTIISWKNRTVQITVGNEAHTIRFGSGIQRHTCSHVRRQARRVVTLQAMQISVEDMWMHHHYSM